MRPALDRPLRMSPVIAPNPSGSVALLDNGSSAIAQLSAQKSRMALHATLK